MMDLRKIKRKVFFFPKLIELISKNWINPFLTLWVNFYSLPFSQAIRLPIFIYGWAKFLNANGEIIISCPKIWPGMIRINERSVSADNSDRNTEFSNLATIIFKGSAQIGCGCKVLTYGEGVIEFGDGFMCAHNVLISSSSRIEFGEHVLCAHQTQIFDTDFHYLFSANSRKTFKNSNKIRIGHHAWLCNRSTILKGVELPPYCIVGVGAMVNKPYPHEPESTLFIGAPAIPKSVGKYRIRNRHIEGHLNELFSRDSESNEVELTDYSIDDLLDPRSEVGK